MLNTTIKVEMKSYIVDCVEVFFVFLASIVSKSGKGHENISKSSQFLLYAWTTAGKDVFHLDTRDVAKSELPTISLAKRELTAGWNCLGKQRHWVILEEQLHKKVSLKNKKACIAFP